MGPFRFNGLEIFELADPEGVGSSTNSPGANLDSRRLAAKRRAPGMGRAISPCLGAPNKKGPDFQVPIYLFSMMSARFKLPMIIAFLIEKIQIASFVSLPP
jgi:hypothetical protein